ncbi:MAG: ABC transporter substrate-binding protein [Chitinivibrionales bacterium]|nr:ABC transporter substrate-binding protein [Chitinivibrionales bacterium]MBD3359053.1 ABC transporter substrate-binding protein [Chitinivibrionales bacterium]
MKPMLKTALFCSAGIAVVVLCGCGSKEPKQTSRKIGNWRQWTEQATEFEPVIGEYGGYLTVTSFGSDPKTFNPITSNETSSMEVLQFVFEGLTTYDVIAQKPVASLAETWTVSEDGLVYDFVLRDDVLWSDGEPLTADDVVFTFNAIYDKRNLSAARDNLTIDGKTIEVVKTGEHSVRMTLPYPFAPFLRVLTGTSAPIVPKHKLENAQAAGNFSSTWEVDTHVDEIVGTGPFSIDLYEPSQRLVLKRNPRYWKSDTAGNQLPYLDGINFLYIKDQSAELLKFKSGASDFYSMRGRDFPVLGPRQTKNDFTIYNLGPALGDIFLIFNQNKDTNPRTGKPYVDPVKLKWFRNTRFRQAIAWCIDREQMINIVHNGLAQPQHTPVNEAAGYFHNADVKKYSYNLDSARAILASEGFIDRDDDGYIEDPDGNPVEFSLNTNSGNGDREKYCEIIRKDLEKVGIQVHYAPLEFNNLVNKLDHTYDWETIVLGLTGTDDPHNGSNVWLSSGRTHEWYPRQKSPSTPWEARIDSIFIKAAQEMDRAKRKELYDEWQSIYANQLPYITLVAKHRLFAVRNKFGNVNPVPIAEAAWFHKRKFFHNIEEIFVLPEYRDKN